MKISEMRTMSILEARKQISELRTELAKERAVAAGGTRPENPGKIKGIKKKIARLLTVINEKLRAGEKEEEKEEKGRKEIPVKKEKPVKKTAKKKKMAFGKKKMAKPKKGKAPAKRVRKAKEKKKSKKEVKKA